MSKTVILQIYRGDLSNQYWEEFKVGITSFSNVISVLMHIQSSPKNIHGKTTTPVAWEQGCLEEVCGSCSMLINGRPRQACSAIIENIIEETGSRVITLAPFTKYPLIRDLVVDRNKMFNDLLKAHAWIDADGSVSREFGPKINPNKQETMYTLSTCMTCGCCTESCPQIHQKSKFVGPAVVSQVRLFNLNPTGKGMKKERLDNMMTEGGISGCGNSQNCVQVCPKKIPLTESIAAMGRDTTMQAWKKIFGKPVKG
mgnify:FL=1